jgi:hypothetical protein
LEADFGGRFFLEAVFIFSRQLQGHPAKVVPAALADNVGIVPVGKHRS